MLMGHYGLAVWDSQRGKKEPLIALWQAFLAVQAVDIVFAILALFGIEGTIMKNGAPFFNIPWSHSLLGSVIISLCAGALFYFLKPETAKKGFWVVTALAFSHWILDLVVHRPDLALYPGSRQFFGLSFWDYPIAAFFLEIGLLFFGLLYWVRVTSPVSKIYQIAPWALFVFLVVLQFLFITRPGLHLQAGTFDPSSQPQGVALGTSILLGFAVVTFLIGFIERGRPSLYASPSST